MVYIDLFNNEGNVFADASPPLSLSLKDFPNTQYDYVENGVLIGVGTLTSLQLAAVPEPSTLTLALTAILVLSVMACLRTRKTS
jgi:hypothetical protein